MCVRLWSWNFKKERKRIRNLKEKEEKQKKVIKVLVDFNNFIRDKVVEPG